MPKFLPGDKVRCIGMSPTYSIRLNIGGVYTVEDTVDGDPGWITVEEDLDCGDYHVGYFEHVDPALNERVNESVSACVIDFVKSTPKKAKAT